MLVLGVRFAKRERKRTGTFELFGFHELEFEEIALAAFGQRDHFFVCAADRTVKVIARSGQRCL